jgi:excisionase family DNA binding protein
MTKERAATVTRYTPVDELPCLLSVEEFCAFTDIGRSAAYDLVRRGALEHVRFGRIVRIPREAVKRVGGAE